MHPKDVGGILDSAKHAEWLSGGSTPTLTEGRARGKNWGSRCASWAHSRGWCTSWWGYKRWFSCKYSEPRAKKKWNVPSRALILERGRNSGNEQRSRSGKNFCPNESLGRLLTLFMMIWNICRHRLGTCSLPAISTPPLLVFHCKNLRLWPHPCPRKRWVSSLLWRWNSWMVQVYSPLWWFVDAKLIQKKWNVERDNNIRAVYYAAYFAVLRLRWWLRFVVVNGGAGCFAIRDGNQGQECHRLECRWMNGLLVRSVVCNDRVFSICCLISLFWEEKKS